MRLARLRLSSRATCAGGEAFADGRGQRSSACLSTGTSSLFLEAADITQISQGYAVEEKGKRGILDSIVYKAWRSDACMPQ